RPRRRGGRRAPLPTNHSDHPRKPGLGLRLQFAPGASGGGRALPGVGNHLVAHSCGNGHGVVFRVGGGEQSPSAPIRGALRIDPMIDSPWLDGRDRYERTMEGWVDNTYDDAFTHTVRIGDDRLRVELSADCTPSPGYEVRAARARVLTAEDPPTEPGRFEDLAGTRMIGGFTRRLTEVAGSRPAARFLVEAGIEVAPLARQAAKLPCVA